MKLYAALALLLFASCSSTEVTESPKKDMSNSQLQSQQVEYEKLEAENQKLKEEVEILNEKIEKVKKLQDDK